MITILEKILSPLSLNAFYKKYWEKDILHIKRNNKSYFDQILSIKDINKYLERNDIRYPHIRLAKNGREVPLSEYANDYVFAGDIFQGNINMDKLFQLYYEGSTINFQLSEKLMPKLKLFSNQLENEFKFPIQIHLFMTPPSSQGFTSHYDTNSFFILQIHGKKTWKIYDSPYKLPLLKHRHDNRFNEHNLTNIEEIELNEGDVLYIPRGVYHEASTSQNSSLHLTLGIFPYIWTDIIKEAIDKIADENVALRKSPVEYSLKESINLQQKFEEILDTVKNKTVLSNLIFEMEKTTKSTQIPILKNRFNDIETLNKLNKDSILECRKIEIGTEVLNDLYNFSFYDKSISFPISTKALIECILRKEKFKISELEGNLDIDSIIMVCERLIIEGFLTFSKPE